MHYSLSFRKRLLGDTCFPLDRDMCKSTLFTQRVEVGGGSKNKDLSCLEEMRAALEQTEKRETADRQQGCCSDCCRSIPGLAFLCSLVFIYFFFFKWVYAPPPIHMANGRFRLVPCCCSGRERGVKERSAAQL